MALYIYSNSFTKGIAFSLSVNLGPLAASTGGVPSNPQTDGYGYDPAVSAATSTSIPPPQHMRITPTLSSRNHKMPIYIGFRRICRDNSRLGSGVFMLVGILQLVEIRVV